MLTANLNGLGDIRADLIKYIGPIVGNQNVASAYDKGVRQLRAEAEAGARAGVNKEIPMIESKVRDAVKPMVIGALIASGIATAVGVASLVISLTR